MQISLTDLVDLNQVQAMAEALHKASGIPIGIIGVDGAILVATGWQDVCVNFHRANPASCHRCHASDQFLAEHLPTLPPGGYVEYKCLNGLWDVGIPIIVDGLHLATCFLGQFFYEGEQPDREFFRMQAMEFGFNEAEYLLALDRVPVFSRAKVQNIIDYDSKLVSLLSSMGMAALKQREELARRMASESKLTNFTNEMVISNTILQQEIIFRKAAEEERDRFFTLSPNFFCVLGAKGYFQRVNLALADALGYPLEEVLQTPYREYIHTDDWEITQTKIQNVLLGDIVHDVPIRLLHRSGRVLWTEWTAVSDDQMLFATGQDVTEKRRLAQNLIENERWLRILFDKTAIGVALIHTATGRFLRINPRYAELVGYTQQEMSAKTFREITHPDDLAVDLANMDQLLAGEINKFSMEKRYIRKDGSIVWVNLTVSPTWQPGETPFHHIAVVEDISYRKQAEEQFIRQKIFNEAILDNIQDGIVACDENGVISLFNKATRLFHGIEEKNLSSDQWAGHYDLYLADGVTPMQMEAIPLFQAFSGQLVCKQEMVIAPKNGIKRTLLATGQAMYDSAGRKLGAVVSMHDITDQKMAEAELALLASEVKVRERVQAELQWEHDKLFGILDAMDDGVYIVDQQYNIEYVNPVVRRAFGSPAQRKCYQYFHDRTDPCPWCKNALVFSGQSVSWEWTSSKTGQTFDLFDAPLRRPDGHISKIEFFHDISEHKRVENALRESEERFRQIFEQNPAVAMLIDPVTGAIMDANLTAERYYGYSSSTLMAMKITDINTLPPDKVAVEIANAVQEKRNHFIFRHKLATGEFRDVEVYSGPVTVSGRKILYSFVHDITERTRAEEALRLRDAILSNMEGGVMLASANDGAIVYVNPKFERMFGYDSGELIGKNISVVNATTDKTPEETATAIISSLIQTGLWAGEIYNRKKDGSAFWCHATVSTFQHPSFGTVWVSVHQDISRRKYLEEALGKHQRLLAETELIGKVGGWECDIDTRKSAWTEEVYHIHEMDLNYDQNIEEVINFYAPDSRPVIAEAVQRTIVYGEPFDLELEIVTAKGNLRSVHTIGKRDLANRRIYGFFQDITERKKAEVALRESEQRLWEIAANLAEGLYVLDGVGKITFINPTALTILGWQKEEVLGQLSHVLFHHTHSDGRPYPPDDCFLFDVVKKSSVISTDDDFLWRRDGTCFPVAVVASPILRNGEAQGAVVAFRDITEKKQTELALRQAKEMAEQAAVAKADFLAAMSHEIRTPMNVVLGMAEVLLETDLNPDQLRFIQTMHHSGKALLGVINDVLDFSRIEAGRFTLDEHPFSPRQVVEETARLMQMAAEEKGLTLVAQVASNIPDAVLGDNGRLRQVLINLLGNAIKFTHQGGVELTLTPHPQKSATLLFRVTDTGIGITPEQAIHIFDRFTQADAGITRRYGGTGLGLAISRRLVEMMGGEIDVESHAVRGSTFFFTLPVRMVEAPMLIVAPVEMTTKDSEIRGLRILLVEDSEDNQALFQAYLKKTPHQLAIVNNGLEAVERVRQDEFDLVLMDMQMPVMDGYTATRTIRQWEQEEERPPLTILALSAHALAEEKEKSLAAGCNDHLTKPIKKQDLLKAIQQIDRYIGKHQ